MQNSELQTLLAALQAFLQRESPEEKAQIVQQHLIQFLINMGSLEFFKENSKLISDNLEVLPLIYKFVKEYSQKSGKILSPKVETLLDKAVEVTVDLSDTIQNSPLSDIQDSIGFVLKSSDAQEYIKSYQGLGKLSLDDAILESEKLLSHPEFQTSNVELRASTLYQGGIAYFTRYTNQGSLPDLEAAISLFEKSIAITPSGSKSPNLYHDLGIALREKYNYSGNIMDIWRSVSLIKKAYDMLIGFSEVNELYLSNMAEIMFSFFKNIHDFVLAYEFMLNKWYQKLTHHHLYVLGLGYFRLFQDTNDRKYIDKAIDIYKKSIGITEPKNPILSKYINNLAACFHARYESYGDKNDLSEALRLYKESLEEGISRQLLISTSLRSSRGLFSLTFSHKDYSEAVKAFNYCSQAIDFIYKAQLLRYQKETWLKEMQGLASQAAYAFTKLNQPQEAVVTLERGIAILLSEALQRDRANLEQLKTTGHTDLYDRYQEIVGRYHWAQQQQNVEALKTTQADLDKTIEDIRQVPGYEDFLKPVEFELIQAAAQETPLVYILTTSAGGLALIVRQAEITPVWLPNMEDTFAGYWEAYIQWRNTPTDQNLRHHWHTTIETTTQQLWTAVMQPLIDALPPHTHLTLIPVGRLNLLPWHAAWTEDAKGRCYALDKLTIAYAPNAVTVTQCQQWAKLTTVPKLLAISEPHPQPPTAGSLHYSRYATPAICSLFPDNTQQLACEQATVAAVTTQLREAHTLWYFYCHGLTNFEEPLKSGLLLAGSQEQFLTLGDVLNLKVTGVRLATLAACETNIPDLHKLPDEVVSLAAGLLQAGVAGVIASLWSVDAVSTAFLMVRCYDILQPRWQTDGNMQAPLVFALQEAQRWLRDSTKRELQEWIDQRQLRQHLDLVQQTELDDLWYDKAEEDRPFAAPYYWAAFVAMGV